MDDDFSRIHIFLFIKYLRVASRQRRSHKYFFESTSYSEYIVIDVRGGDFSLEISTRMKMMTTLLLPLRFYVDGG